MPHFSFAIVEAVVAGAVLGSLADWLFAGVLFHDRYRRHPEVWRDAVGERGRILAAQALTILTSTVMVLLAVRLGQTNLCDAVKLALAIWLIAPLPMLVTNHMFIKIDALVTASHAIGWLVKLLLMAGAIALLLR
ncbi:MAG TPA: DUF1761 domain-containing protein [Sphingomonas sp.]|nr:DUF1761 domain-containing protein [Sphingomonas sp.]